MPRGRPARLGRVKFDPKGVNPKGSDLTLTHQTSRGQIDPHGSAHRVRLTPTARLVRRPSRGCPPLTQPSRTRCAATRCLRNGILDRCFAAGLWAFRVAGRANARRCDRFLHSEIERRAIVRSRKPGVQPFQELGPRSQWRYAFVVEGGEHGTADQDFPSCIAPAFCVTGASEQPILLGS